MNIIVMKGLTYAINKNVPPQALFLLLAAPPDQAQKGRIAEM